MSITLDILIALADHPDGEAPIATIKDRLVQAALSPGRLAELVSVKRTEPRQRLRSGGRDALEDLFSNGLVEKPRPGIWRLTARGRAYLACFKSKAEERAR